MRWILAIAACAACSSDGGAGANLETVATLPVATGYTVGFAADGTPLLGFHDARPMLRFDGTGWVPHAVTTPLQVTGFGLDLDGASLVLHQVATSYTQVDRLEPNGTVTPLGDFVLDQCDEVFQHVSGSRFLLGNSTWILRPGATAWERTQLALFNVRRGPGGQTYARAFSGVLRFGQGDTPALVADCSAGICGTSRFGVDAGGRLYFDRTDEVMVFDETKGSIASVKLPGEQFLHAFALTDRQSLVVGEVLGGEGGEGIEGAAPSDGRAVFAVGGEEVGFAILPMHTPHPLTSSPATVHVDPANTIYIAQDDWLGRVVSPP